MAKLATLSVVEAYYGQNPIGQSISWIYFLDWFLERPFTHGGLAAAVSRPADLDHAATKSKYSKTCLKGLWKIKPATI